MYVFFFFCILWNIRSTNNHHTALTSIVFQSSLATKSDQHQPITLFLLNITASAPQLTFLFWVKFYPRTFLTNASNVTSSDLRMYYQYGSSVLYTWMSYCLKLSRSVPCVGRVRNGREIDRFFFFLQLNVFILQKIRKSLASDPTKTLPNLVRPSNLQNGSRKRLQARFLLQFKNNQT